MKELKVQIFNSVKYLNELKIVKQRLYQGITSKPHLDSIKFGDDP